MRPSGKAERWLALHVVLCSLALVWPGFAWIPADRPRVLGLPFALAWVVGWCLATFAALAAYHRAQRSPA